MTTELLHIIKAQIKYMINGFLPTLAMALGLLGYAYIRNFNPINLICFIIFVQYVSLVLLNNAKENREYIFRLITLSEKQIAKTRIILVYLGFISIYSFGYIFHLVLTPESYGFRGSFQELFMFGGIALSGVFLYLIVADNYTIFKAKSNFLWFNVIIAFIIGIVSFAIIIGINNSYRASVFSSTFLVIVLYFVAALLSRLSLFSYRQRKSYLGYK